MNECIQLPPYQEVPKHVCQSVRRRQRLALLCKTTGTPLHASRHSPVSACDPTPIFYGFDIKSCHSSVLLMGFCWWEVSEHLRKSAISSVITCRFAAWCMLIYGYNILSVPLTVFLTTKNKYSHQLFIYSSITVLYT